MNEIKQESVNTEEMIKIHIAIDCDVYSISPNTYMESICKNILKQEYKDPNYTCFGAWGLEYEIPKSKYEEHKKSVMEYLTKLYNDGAIRYGEYSEVGE